jgi:Icc-related predicted phosphoesterase
MSDTHDDHFPAPETLPRADVLLHCGDLTQIGGLSSFKKAIRALEQVLAELKLVIAGNHDVSLDRKWWKENLVEDEDDPEEPDRARELFEEAKAKGVYLLDEGTYTFTLKSGVRFTIFASPYTPEFNGYAFAYGVDEDRFNPGTGATSPIPDKADILMTHGPPKLDHFTGEYNLDINHKDEHCGCLKLTKALERCRPKLHCFGHLHEGYGGAMVDWGERRVESVGDIGEDGVKEIDGRGMWEGRSLLVNAAIQTPEGVESKGPWMVVLDLPITGDAVVG